MFDMSAPYKAFGKIKVLPVKVYIDGRLLEGVYVWEEELWIEREEDWYTFMSPQLKGKNVRVVTREDWLKY